MVESQAGLPSTPSARLMDALAGVLGSMSDLETYLSTLVFAVMEHI